MISSFDQSQRAPELNFSCGVRAFQYDSRIDLAECRAENSHPNHRSPLRRKEHTMQFGRLLLAGASCLWLSSTSFAAEPAPNTPIQDDIVKYVDSIRADLVSANQDIWT